MITMTAATAAKTAAEAVEKSADACAEDALLPSPDKFAYNNKGYRKIILLSRVGAIEMIFNNKILYLSHITPSNKKYTFLQHGESENNFSGKIGGDTNLSQRGRAYASALASYINSLDFQYPVEVWTSGLKRTIATAAGVKCNKRKAMKELNELHAVSHMRLKFI